MISEEPARLFGLYPQKGALLEGSDADLVIFNPEGAGQISVKKLHSAIDWSPYENLEIRGKINDVMLRGKWLLRDSKVKKRNLKKGKFVKALI